MRLLTVEHPEEIDEKYTALAETAWIARLARDIVCLTFGWQPGAKGEEQRVFVVPGGLTAKARRNRKIDSLLADPGEIDPDKIDQKNRADDRHHALDAMVLSFITQTKPQLPEGIHREFFRPLIEKVTPEPIAFNKPVLDKTIYARRFIGGEEAAVKRISLADIDTVKKNVKKIIDPSIRGQIKRFLDMKPDKEAWASFIKTLHQSADHGGSRVIRAAVEIGSLEEYANLSKNDGKGQWRRAKQHQGQFVYRDEKERPKIRPVYVFESKRTVKAELIEKGYTIIDFFESGCLVEIPIIFTFSDRVIPAGKYILRSINAKGQVWIKSTLPVLKNPVGIAALLTAGFRRVR